MKIDIKDRIMILLNRVITSSGWNESDEKNNFGIDIEEKEEDLYKLIISVLNNDIEFKEHIYISKYTYHLTGDCSYIDDKNIYRITENIFADLLSKRIEALSKEVHPVEAIEIIKNDLLVNKFKVIVDYNADKKECFFVVDYIN